MSQTMIRAASIVSHLGDGEMQLPRTEDTFKHTTVNVDLCSLFHVFLGQNSNECGCVGTILEVITFGTHFIGTAHWHALYSLICT